MDYCGIWHKSSALSSQDSPGESAVQEAGDNKKKPQKTELETFGNDYKTSCDFPEESTEVHENFLYYTQCRFSVYEFKSIQLAANHADKQIFKA